VNTTIAEVALENMEQDYLSVDGVFWYTKIFITLWFGFDYGTNPTLGTLII
jgi:hypothetical protein